MKYKQRKSARTTSVAESTNIAMKKHRKVKRWQCVTGVLAVVVLLCATYTMILPALTMEQQAYCGQEEHVHTDACYEQRLICGQEEQHTHKEECYADVETCVCGQEETEGHTHSEECYAEDGTCVCGVEETAGHTHDEACYLVQKELVCTVPVGDASHTHTDNCYEKVLVCGKEEHTHNLMCYSNPEADVESQTAWERSVSGVTLTGVWADDLVAIAESQLGYKESANNYILDENGNIKGYSRYGAWCGDAYGDWCAMFASYCLNYAEIPSEDMPYETSCVRWIEKLSELDMYEEVDSYVPQKGDLIFFSSQENGTESDHVGIVSVIITDTEETPVKLHVIEGDSENSVAERTYELNDSHILGYGKLPESPKNMQLAVTAEAQETPPLADIDLSALTPEELTALLEQITPEDLQAYLESLSDEEYDNLMDNLSEEAREILKTSIAGEQDAVLPTKISEKQAAITLSAQPTSQNGSFTVRHLVDDTAVDSTFEIKSVNVFSNKIAYTPYPNSSAATISNPATFQLTNSSEYGMIYVIRENRNDGGENPKPIIVIFEPDGNMMYKQVSEENVEITIAEFQAHNTLLTSGMDLSDDPIGAAAAYQEIMTTEPEPTTEYYNNLAPLIDINKRLAETKSEFYKYAILLKNNNLSDAQKEEYTRLFDDAEDAYENVLNEQTEYENEATLGWKDITNKYHLTSEHGIELEEICQNYVDELSANEIKKTVEEHERDNNITKYTEPLTFSEKTQSGGLSIQIPAKKIIDGGQTDIGDNQFTFKLTGNDEELYATSDAEGNVLFPEIIYTKPGTYTYTIEEVTDDRDGVTFDFDDSKQTVKVVVSSHDVQTYDPDAKYYAFEEYDGDLYYYVDTVPGRKGIVMYCTNESQSGPQDPTSYPYTPVEDQTYKAVINPTITEIVNNGWVAVNRYGTDLSDKLKKIFYYFETAAGQKMSNTDKQKMVWTATDANTRGLNESYTINGMTASNDANTVLENIYATVTLPPFYNLVFFVPTDKQALDPSQGGHPQPLATGYGAVIETTSEEAVFDNKTLAQNSLKIGKTVTGTAGETERLFNFTISLWNQYFSQLTGNFDVIPGSIEGVEAPAINQITFSYGSATVQLKHGQYITIVGLPDQFHYHVTETEWSQDGYSSSLTKDPNSNYADYGGATGAVDIEFTNHKDTPQPPPSYEAQIRVTKTLNGGIPEDGQFTFILRNNQGEEIDRKTNDANGEVIFPLTITETGTYTYTVEEFNDGQEGIVYDTEVKTVTVTVGSESLQEIVDGNSFVGSGTQGNYKITVNGTKELDVYCINGAVGNPYGNYDKVLNPTTAQFAAEVTANYYGNALAENMRKLLYYFDTHSYSESVTGDENYSITLNKAGRQELIWCLTGNPGEQHISYQDPLNKILAESNPPSDYAVVMFASTGNAQPVIAGYLPTMNVVYEGEATMVEFANYYEYELPETGGIGTTGYTIGGLLLMSGALLLMYKTKLARKKEGKC